MFTIAEVGMAHDGSIGMAHSFIDALAQTGVDAIKFQMHFADAESSLSEPFRIQFSYADKTRYDYWLRTEFSAEQWSELKKHCEERGIQFIISPFSCRAVDVLEKMDTAIIKIGSGEVANRLMIDKIAKLKKKVIVSTGMSNLEETESCVGWLELGGTTDISILQCTTAYPCPPEKWGINVISELKKHFKYPIGFSDHSGSVVAGMAAACAGAEVLEFHVTFDKAMFGPDSKASLTIAETFTLISALRDIECSRKCPVNKDATEEYKLLRTIFGKSLAFSRNMQSGHQVTMADLESKKPGDMGIPASDYNRFIGRILKTHVKAGSFLSENMFL